MRPAHVLELCEAGLAHHPLGQQPAGQCNLAAFGFQRLGRSSGPASANSACRSPAWSAASEVVRKRHALPAQCGQFGAALGDQAVLVDGVCRSWR
jgi:hypothetical protein